MTMNSKGARLSAIRLCLLLFVVAIVVTAFGITDRPMQDEMLEAVKKVDRKGFKPIIVRFYEREVWDNHKGYDFGQAKLLRRAVLR